MIAGLIGAVAGLLGFAADGNSGGPRANIAAVMDQRQSLKAATWYDLGGFETADHSVPVLIFRRWCSSDANGSAPLRETASAAKVPLDGACAKARGLPTTLGRYEALRFLKAAFRPWRIEPSTGRGLLTGYYEPEIDGSRVRTQSFRAPILGRPDDLVSFGPDEHFYSDEKFGAGAAPLTAARRRPDGLLEPYAERAALEAAADGDRPQALVWLRDQVEVFLVQVQGSARVKLPDGARVRLVYDGRNGHPYTSIGKILVDEGLVPRAEMSLARLKQWLRVHPAPGKAIMDRNRSYIFFKVLPDTDPTAGPLGGAGVALTPLGSLAIDRHIWSYGLPFWIDAALPWRSPEIEPFQRLMIAQDTGAAIVGPARADIFFGTGAAAGERAGNIRHPGAFFVLLPKDFRL